MKSVPELCAVSLSELPNVVKFHTGAWEYEARVGEHVVGTLRPQYAFEEQQKEIKLFREKVLYRLASLCTTVELVTGCGCRRLQEGMSQYARTYEVPLCTFNHAIGPYTGEQIPAASYYKVRQFCWEGRYADSGVRQFHEVSNG